MVKSGRIGFADPATRPPAQAPSGLGDTASVRCASDFSIGDVLAWARTKPARDRYEFSSNTNCALCQFLRETGRASHPTAGGATWSSWAKAPYSGEALVHFAPIPDPLAVPCGPLQAGTFGGLVARLEALAPETIVPPSEWTRLDAYMNDIELASA